MASSAPRSLASSSAPRMLFIATTLLLATSAATAFLQPLSSPSPLLSSRQPRPQRGHTPTTVLSGQRRGQFVGGSLEFGESPSGGGKKGGKNKKRNTPVKGKQRNKEPSWTDVSGVTFPEKAGDIRAWELNFGEKGAKKFACVRPKQSEVYLIDGECSRCSFDLWRGEVILPSDGSPARLSCPVCRQVYELPTGEPKGIQVKEGLGGWVNGLARSATLSDREKPITSYPIRARRPTEEDQQNGQGKGGLIVEVDFTNLKD